MRPKHLTQLGCFLLLSGLLLHTPPCGFGRPKQPPLSELRERTGLAIRKRANALEGPALTPPERKLLRKIATAAENRRWPEARSYFAGYRGSGTQIYGAAMNAAFRCREYKEGAKIYDQCRENCEFIGQPIFSSGLRIFAKLGSSCRVDEIWCEALNASELNEMLGSARIAAAADLGDADAAAEALEKMDDCSVPIDVYHINSAMRSCWAEGESEQAKYFFDQMPRFQLSPTVVSFTSLIGAYRRASLQDISSAYDEMKALKIKPDSVFAETFTYSVLQSDKRAHVRLERTLCQKPMERLEAARDALEDFRNEGLQLSKMCEAVSEELRSMGI